MYKLISRTTMRFSSGPYDVVVVGGGPGGYVAAIKAGQLGMKAACVQKRGSLGGTCLNVGCIPSKALLNISHKYIQSQKAFKEMGIQIGSVKMNWDQTLIKKDKIVKGLTGGIQYLFKKNKVDYLKGQGKFKSKEKLQIKSSDGNVSTIQAKNYIIATGSQPTPFPGLQFDQKIIVSSTGALSIPKIPKSMIVIGGGVIGLQMGSVYARLGTQVTVIQYFDRICPFMDVQVGNAFTKIMAKQMKILNGHKVISGKNNGANGQVTIQPVKGGQKKTLSADHILISTGRKPYTHGLGLQNAGIKIDQKGRIPINDSLQTEIPSIFAIGDVVRGPMLAHKSQQQGIAAVQHIAGKGGHVNYEAIPSVIYTHPEVAWVGKTQQQLKKEGISFKKGVFPMMANSRAKTNDDYQGLVKIISEAKSDKILGMHIVGVAAGEMIIQGVIGINYGASSQDIGRTCHAHPTLSEAVKQACMSVYEKPIHF